MQEYTSAKTSINSNKVPAVFKAVQWTPGTINFDNGGGKFDTATDYLAALDVINVVYDKFNRVAEYNQAVLDVIGEKLAHTSTIANVLNVVKEPEVRQEILRLSHRMLFLDGFVYVWIYEGDKSGIGKATRNGWQENRLPKTYVDEVAKLFEVVKVSGNLIVGKKVRCAS